MARIIISIEMGGVAPRVEVEAPEVEIETPRADARLIALRQAVLWASSAEGANSTDRHVLMTIAAMFDGASEGTVPQSDIGERCAMSRKTVAVALARLRSAGLIESESGGSLGTHVRLLVR